MSLSNSTRTLNGCISLFSGINVGSLFRMENRRKDARLSQKAMKEIAEAGRPVLRNPPRRLPVYFRVFPRTVPLCEQRFFSRGFFSFALLDFRRPRSLI